MNEKTVGEQELAEIILLMSTFTVAGVPDFVANTYDASCLNAVVQQSSATRNLFSIFGNLFRK